MARWRPGSVLLVQYAHDPGWSHERVRVWPCVGDSPSWRVRTGCEHYYREYVRSWTRIWDVTGVDYPSDLEGQVVQFQAPVEPAQLRDWVASARQDALDLAKGEGLDPVAGPTLAYDWNGGTITLGIAPARSILKRIGRKSPSA